MVEPTVSSFCTSATSKIHTEVGPSSLLKLVSLGESCVDLRLAPEKRGRSLYPCISVCQVLIIPDVIIVIAFDVGSILLRLLNLSPGLSLHPSSHLVVFKLLKLSNLLLVLLSFFLFLSFFLWLWLSLLDNFRHIRA